ncbi:MAG: glycoside hydrolase family 13 protein [Saccharofermentans sp.]|nr:glycoside hydrolase family 13 protein [Saccharofermentans sp.]
MFLHASRDLKYRTPYGAQPVDTKVTIRFDASSDCRNVTLCYTYGLYGFSYHEEPMYEVKAEKLPERTTRYEVGIMLPHEPGLVFYWFRFSDMIEREVETEDGADTVTEYETRYYVMEADTEDGAGKIYHEPPRVAADEDKYPYAWQITTYNKNFKTPDYMKGALIYQIFPDRFARDEAFTVQRMKSASDREERVYHDDWYEDVDIEGKPSTGYLACDFYGGSLKGIEEHLDYIKSLGIDIIYLNPIFEARSSHRYDTADYLSVDPMLGGNGAFASFKDACESKGIKIILDGVFSHTGADSRYFNKFGRYEGTGAFEAYEKGVVSPYRSWYHFYKNEHGYTVYDSWWGFPDLPNVDENNLSYRQFIFGDGGVVDTWMKRGASGLRLDVSDELPDSFIRQMRDTIKDKTNGEGMLVGEVWEDASNKCSYGSYRDFMLGNTHDSVMGYTFRTTVLEYLQGYVSAKVFNARLEGFRERYPAQSYYCIMNLMSSHDVPRMYTMMSKPQDTADKSAQRDICVPELEVSRCAALCKMAYALQIEYPGAACTYYGDEILMNGYKDPFNRRTYPWGKVDGEAQEHLDFYRKLASLRVNNRVLRTGFYRTVYTTEEAIVMERFLDSENRDFFGNLVTAEEDARRIVLIVNRGHEGIYLSLNEQSGTLKVEEVKKPAVSLSNECVVNGISGSPMQIGVATNSIQFVIYEGTSGSNHE